MQLAVSCSSLGFADRTWQEALAEIARLGFRWADIAMFEGWVHVNPSELTEPEQHGDALAQECERRGLEPIALHANFAVGDRAAFPGLTTPDADARRVVLEHFRRVVRCAEAARIPLVNVQPGRFIEGLSREACLLAAAEMLTRMVEEAGRHERVLAFENHTGSIGQEPEDALFLLERAGGLTLDYDLSHVVACGHGVEDTRELLPYVTHVGIRNATRGNYNEPVEDGHMHYDVAAFLDALREADVGAFVSVEYYEPEMQASIPELKRVLEGLGLPAS